MERVRYDDVVESTGHNISDRARRAASRLAGIDAAVATGLLVLHPSTLSPERQPPFGSYDISVSNNNISRVGIIVTGASSYLSEIASDTATPPPISPADAWPNTTNTNLLVPSNINPKAAS